MAKLGTEKNPARVRVQTEERGNAIMALCNEKKWQVIIGIEADKNEDISDIEKLNKPSSSRNIFLVIPRNAPCPCGSGKQYKRCCGK